MVVDDLNAGGALFGPSETDTPLIVDANGILPGPVAFQVLEVVSRRETKILDDDSGIERRKHGSGSLHEISRKVFAKAVPHGLSRRFPFRANDRSR
jgi:hypothetical protein